VDPPAAFSSHFDGEPWWEQWKESHGMGCHCEKMGTTPSFAQYSSPSLVLRTSRGGGVAPKWRRKEGMGRIWERSYVPIILDVM
jgi:hypothetical protein